MMLGKILKKLGILDGKDYGGGTGHIEGFRVVPRDPHAYRFGGLLMGKRSNRRPVAKPEPAAARASIPATRPTTPLGAGRRSFPSGFGFGGIGGGGGGVPGGGNMLAPYHAASWDPSIPRVGNPGPRALVQYMPTLRYLVRHYARNSTARPPRRPAASTRRAPNTCASLAIGLA